MIDIAESSAAAHDEILVVESLSGYFNGPDGRRTPALEKVSFALKRGSITGLVGETGSGKSLIAYLTLRIQPRSFVRSEGRITLDGEDIFKMDDMALRRLRGSRISMVFQDPRAALNPVFSVGTQLVDVCRLHQRVSRREARRIVLETLRRVRIPDPERRADQYPHEFSGGMAQRVLIAMALICKPDVLILDEPTTGLDVSTQADILRLIVDMTDDVGLTTCLITHDLGVVAETCQDVVVIRNGSTRESGTCEEIFTDPRDDYTKALLGAISGFSVGELKGLGA